jgi:hypothetical protein
MPFGSLFMNVLRPETPALAPGRKGGRPLFQY